MDSKSATRYPKTYIDPENLRHAVYQNIRVDYLKVDHQILNKTKLPLMCPCYGYGEPCKQAILRNWCVFTHDQHTRSGFQYIVDKINNREEIFDSEIDKILGSKSRTMK